MADKVVIVGDGSRGLGFARLQAWLLGAGCMVGDIYKGEPIKRKAYKKEISICLMCGIEHNHNNCYCSAKCCMEHRLKLKNNINNRS